MERIAILSDVHGNLTALNTVINDIERRGISKIYCLGDSVIKCANPDKVIDILHDASKTLLKEDPNSKDWIFAKRNGKPSIINCCHLTDSMKSAKNKNGNYLYRETNILAHLFNVHAIEKICDISLPYHRAFKKNTFVNDEGMKQVPESPNTFKFETFIFDAFSLFDDITLLRVDSNDEFAPIKDFNGPHNPEVAKELYEKKYNYKKH